MSFFKKLYNRGEEQVNKLRDKFYDPVDEFKNELAKLKGEHKLLDKYLAGLSAARIRAEEDIKNHIDKIEIYSNKVKDILAASKNGEMTKDAAEKMAMHTLSLKKAYEDRIDELKIKIPEFDEEIIILKEKVSEIKNKIKHYQTEYDFLKIKAQINENNLNLRDKNFYDYSEITERLENLKKKIENSEHKDETYKKYSEKYSEDNTLIDQLKNELDLLKSKQEQDKK